MILLVEHVLNQVPTALPVYHQAIDFCHKEVAYANNIIFKSMDNKIVCHVNGHVPHALIQIVAQLVFQTLIERKTSQLIMMIIVIAYLVMLRI